VPIEPKALGAFFCVYFFRLHLGAYPMSTVDEAERSEPKRSDRSMTRAEFCAAENISLSTYHKMQRDGNGPTEKHFPGMALVRITAKARAEWHKHIETWNKSKAARLEGERRALLAKAAGLAAAKSPLHVSNRNKKAARQLAKD
jgi:hypothetical protein